MVNPNRFYTYAYLREDRTPYYIGKGQGKRLYRSNGRPCGVPKDKTRIIFLKQNLTEQEAFKHEIYMIAVFGRKDIGTGILRNKTNGGDGTSGAVRSEETRRKHSEAIKGEKNHNYGKSPSKETRRILSELNKGENSSNYGKKWWNDGEGNVKFLLECPGEGWVPGIGKSPSEETRRKQSIRMKGKNNSNYGKIGKSKGKKWWNDGCGNYVRSVECPGEGWVPGMDEEHKMKCSVSKKGKKWWNNGNGDTKFSKECPGEGWFPGRGKLPRKLKTSS